MRLPIHTLALKLDGQIVLWAPIKNCSQAN